MNLTTKSLRALTIYCNVMCAEGDPNNYLTYFKRGTVYYALGKAKFALQDFTKVNTDIVQNILEQ